MSSRSPLAENRTFLLDVDILQIQSGEGRMALDTYPHTTVPNVAGGKVVSRSGLGGMPNPYLREAA
jgi:hypothetical protein